MASNREELACLLRRKVLESICEMWKCWIWQKQIEGGLDGVKGNERWFSVRGFSAPGKCPTRKITGLEREALAVIIIIITRPKRQGLRIGWYPGTRIQLGRVHFGVFLQSYFVSFEEPHCSNKGLVSSSVWNFIKVMLVTTRSIDVCKFYCSK